MQFVFGGLWVTVKRGLKSIHCLRGWIWQTPCCCEVRRRCFQLKERLIRYPATDLLSYGWLLLTRGWLQPQGEAYRLFKNSLRRHRYGRASRIASIVFARHPESSDAEAMQCTLALRSGDLDRGLLLLEQRLLAGDRRAVERLLFRTGSRPADLLQSFTVLETIALHGRVLASHRCYARIAQSYIALKQRDLGRARAVLVELHKLACEQATLPGLGACPQPNRQNQAKLMVSLCTASYHLAVLLGDDRVLERAWQQVIELESNLDFARLNPDAALRMSSNLSRCLAVGWMLEPKSEVSASQRQGLILHLLASVQQAVADACERDGAASRRRTQENHWALMRMLQEDLLLLSRDDSPASEGACKRLAAQLNHSSSQALTELLEQRLQAVLNR